MDWRTGPPPSMNVSTATKPGAPKVKRNPSALARASKDVKSPAGVLKSSDGTDSSASAGDQPVPTATRPNAAMAAMMRNWRYIRCFPLWL